MIKSVNLPPSAHPVYTLQQSLHLQCMLQPCTAMYSYLQPTFSVHCSQLQPSTTIYTAAILSSAHCNYTIQCTLQLYHPVHSAATLSGSNTTQYIQCTFEPPQGKPIPLLAYLQNSQQTLMADCSSPYDEEDWLIVAVQMMKKTG